MNITDVKIGTTFEYEGKLYKCIECMHVSRPRLAALIKTKIKNIETGQVLDKNWSPSENVGEVYMERKDMQYSYEDGDLVYFMDTETYDQVPVEKEIVKDVMNYVIDGTVVNFCYAQGKLIDITPPIFVELVIVDCEPAVQGDTSRTAYKPAKMETGLIVKVPLFVTNGEKIKIDTRTGEYVSRV